MKIFNFISIGIISIGILILSSFLWIGSLEQVEAMKINLFSNILKRTLGFTLVGIIMILPILGINYYRKKRILQIGLIGTILIVMCSLIGTLLFFN